jgi:hypothetical protein
LQICEGLKLFEKKFNLGVYENIKPDVFHHRVLIEDAVKICPNHRYFLNSL